MPGRAMAEAWPLEVEEHGPVAAGVRVYRRGTELRVGVTVKVTLEVRTGEAMRVVAAEPLVRNDVFAPDGDQTAPLRLASEVGLPLPGAEALLEGFAYAPHGGTTTRVAVRFVVERDRQLVDGQGDGSAVRSVDKELFVYGDRTSAGMLTPFDRIGFGGERPAGGVVDPVDPRKRATFGPLGPASPERGGAVGAALASARASPVLELPEDFDPTLFHVAPPDQRFDAIFGDETIRVEGVHPHARRLESRLPGVRAIASLREPTAISVGERRVVNLRADTLRFHAEAMRCFVLWRGSFAVPSEAALKSLRLAASLAQAPRPLA
jgi:hypothetical protein